jgi:iron complex outermembrane receptor protein
MSGSSRWLPSHRLAFCALALVPLTGNAQLEEIVVTAQRRETALQATPASMQVFRGSELHDAGVLQGRDLSMMVPNVVLSSTGIGGGGFGAYYARGVPGVGIYVDGVWQGARGFLEGTFAEIERVEVVRGPQGTLYGRNSNGGAVLVTTRRPAETFGARATLTAGDNDRRDATLAVDLPLSQAFKTKWMAARLYNDGFLESLSAARALGGQDDTVLRGDVLWEPTQRLSFRLVVNDEETRTSEPRIVRFTNTTHPRYIAYNVLAGNPTSLAAARALDPTFPNPPFELSTNLFTPESHETRFPGGELGKWQTRSNTADDGTAHDIEYATLLVDWRVAEHISLAAITSTRSMARRARTDRDGSELAISELDFRTREESLSHEIHITGQNFAGSVDWLAGTYHLAQEFADRRHAWVMWEFMEPSEGPGRPNFDAAAVDYVRRYGALLGIPGLAPALALPNPFPGFTPLVEQVEDSLTGGEDTDRALFGEVTVAATERLELTVGARVTAHDGRDIVYAPTDGFRPAMPGLPASGDAFKGFLSTVNEDPDLGSVTTRKVAATYRVRNALMLYGSWSQGFTAGDIVTNRLLPAPIVLDPEVVSTRELGLRSSWLEGRLRFNATYFHSMWDGMRVPILPDDPNNPGQKLPSPITTSAGLAETEGFELDLAWTPTDSLLVTAGVGLLDARHLEIGDPDPSGVNGIQPWSRLAYAPDASSSVALRYNLGLASGAGISFAASYGWMDDYFRAAANQWTPVDALGRPRPEPGYGILNARVRLRPAAGSWNLELWGRNLTDEWYVNGGIDSRTVWGFEFATLGIARELGVTFGFEL